MTTHHNHEGTPASQVENSLEDSMERIAATLDRIVSVLEDQTKAVKDQTGAIDHLANYGTSALDSIADSLNHQDKGIDHIYSRRR